MSVETFIFVDFFAVKCNGSDVNPGICVIVKTRSYRHTENISLDFEPNRYYFMKTNRNSKIHVTSVDFNSKKIHKGKIFERQNILQFFSGVSKDYKYVRSLTWDRHFKYICISSTLHVVSDVQARVESSSILTSVPVYSAVASRVIKSCSDQNQNLISY